MEKQVAKKKKKGQFFFKVPNETEARVLETHADVKICDSIMKDPNEFLMNTCIALLYEYEVVPHPKKLFCPLATVSPRCPAPRVIVHNLMPQASRGLVFSTQSISGP